jgi:DNA-binding NarL/FixJ family response regulator
MHWTGARDSGYSSDALFMKTRVLLITSPLDEKTRDHALQRIRRSAPAAKVTELLTIPMPGASGGRRLTRRQQQVLLELVVGTGVKEIAGHMGVSPKTIESHRQNLTHRLGIHHLPGLVRYALQTGLLPASWLADGIS